jgi:hypothetical protein
MAFAAGRSLVAQKIISSSLFDQPEPVDFGSVDQVSLPGCIHYITGNGGLSVKNM